MRLTLALDAVGQLYLEPGAIEPGYAASTSCNNLASGTGSGCGDAPCSRTSGAQGRAGSELHAPPHTAAEQLEDRGVSQLCELSVLCGEDAEEILVEVCETTPEAPEAPEAPEVHQRTIRA